MGTRNVSTLCDSELDSVMPLSYVCGFMIEPSQERVLLIHKTHPPFQKDKWNGIGGKVEPNESAIDAMVREFREETGVSTTTWMWQHTISLGVRDDYVVHYYRSFIKTFPDYRTTTDEEVKVWNIDKVYNCVIIEKDGNWHKSYDCPTLANMRWILALSLTHNIGFPFTLKWKDSH